MHTNADDTKPLLLCHIQQPIHVEKPLENVVFKSLTLKTIHGRKIFHTWEETEAIVAANRYIIDKTSYSLSAHTCKYPLCVG